MSILPIFTKTSETGSGRIEPAWWTKHGLIIAVGWGWMTYLEHVVDELNPIL
jgi:hypothetical protein